jgi:hypothetical protein
MVDGRDNDVHSGSCSLLAAEILATRDGDQGTSRHIAISFNCSSPPPQFEIEL